MKISAGLLIIQDNKILLCHPTGSPWYKTYSIPKGHVDENENILEAAIRETKEETGIIVNINDIQTDEELFVDYTDENGNVYKRVYYFLLYPSIKISKLDFTPQIEEVDWVGFLTLAEAEKRIFGRFKPLLKFLN